MIKDDQLKSETHIYAKGPHLVSENIMEPLQSIFGQAIGRPKNVCTDICDDIWSGNREIQKIFVLIVLMIFGRQKGNLKKGRDTL